MPGSNEEKLDRLLDDFSRVNFTNKGGFTVGSASTNPFPPPGRPQAVFAPKTSTAERYGILYVQKEL